MNLFDSAVQCEFNGTTFIFVSCLEVPKVLIENMGMHSFLRFLDDWGTKYLLLDFLKIWHGGSKREVL